MLLCYADATDKSPEVDCDSARISYYVASQREHVAAATKTGSRKTHFVLTGLVNPFQQKYQTCAKTFASHSSTARLIFAQHSL